MRRRKIHAGTTNLQEEIFLQDSTSTTGGGLSGITSATGGLVIEYRGETDSAWTAITLVSGTLGTYTSGGFIASGSLAGAYVLGVPAACLASARGKSCRVRWSGATNLLADWIDYELDAVDYQSANGFITGINGATAGTSGGPPTVDAVNNVHGLQTRTVSDASVIGTSTYAGADTAGTTTLLTRLPQAVLFDGSGYVKADTEHWAAAALPTSFTASNLPSTYPIDFTAALPGTPTAGTVGEALKFSDTRLDAAVSTRLATAGYTAPDNADIATALADLVTLLSRTDPTTALTALTTTAAAIKAKTDNLPASPAAVSDVTGSTTAVNAHTDTAVSTLATATNLTAVKTDTGNLILMTTGTGTNRAYTVPALANAPASGGSATIVTRQDINAPIVNNPR